MKVEMRGVFLFVLVLSLSQCARSVPEVEVLSAKDADSSLIGDEIVLQERGVAFNAPKNWTTEAQTGAIEAPLGVFTVTPEKLLVRDDGLGFCLVSALVPADSPGEGDPLKTYMDELSDRFKNADNISYKNLRINRLPGILLRITEKENLIYKFVVLAGEDSYLQLDFVFPIREFDDSVLSKMRASVSTLRAVHPDPALNE
jgi:hypothetical protein